MPILKELNGENVDIIDFHWFGLVGEWKELPRVIKRVRNELHQCGFGNVPIWFTEMGTYSSDPDSFRRHDEFIFQSEREQASEMVKRYVMALSAGVKKVFWAWGMIEGFQDSNDNDFFDNTGFVYDGIGVNDPGRGVKKIVYWTHQKMSDLLQYWDGNLPEKVDIDPSIYAYRFHSNNNANSGIVGIWID